MKNVRVILLESRWGSSFPLGGNNVQEVIDVIHETKKHLVHRQIERRGALLFMRAKKRMI